MCLQECKSWLRQYWRLPNCGRKKPPHEGFPAPTIWTPEQENKRNPQGPLKTEKILISLFSDRQNQLHKSNLSWRLQVVSLWPPFKGGWPRSPPEGDFPVWRSEQITQENEDWFFSSKGKFCETISRGACNPISKNSSLNTTRQWTKKGVSNEVGNTFDKIYRDIIQDRISWDK